MVIWGRPSRVLNIGSSDPSVLLGFSLGLLTRGLGDLDPFSLAHFVFISIPPLWPIFTPFSCCSSSHLSLLLLFANVSCFMKIRRKEKKKDSKQVDFVVSIRTFGYE